MSMNTCPNCGGPKSTAAKTCQECYLSPKKVIRSANLVCPQCGGRKSHKISKVCATCRKKNGDKLKKKQTTCPDCGGKMTRYSERCRKCLAVKNSIAYQNGELNRFTSASNTIGAASVDISNVSDAWLYFFSGLFCGEGYATITRNRKQDSKKYLTYHARLGITMRDDETDLITDIRDKLGGQLHFYTKGGTASMPSVRWTTHAIADINVICEAVIKHSPLPAKKIAEVENVLDFTNWRMSHIGIVDWSIAQDFYLRNKDLKRYR